jgi:long-chain-fatty-acid--CoA ligase ACSBG
LNLLNICSGFAAGIYTTNTAEACLHCAINGQADIIVVEDRKQLEKILAIKDQIPTLKAIIQYSGKPHVEGVITVSSFFFNSSRNPCGNFLVMLF